MARPKKARKPREQGVAKTLYLRLGVVQDVEREAQREDLSVSAFVERLLVRELNELKAARSAA